MAEPVSLLTNVSCNDLSLEPVHNIRDILLQFLLVIGQLQKRDPRERGIREVVSTRPI